MDTKEPVDQSEEFKNNSSESSGTSKGIAIRFVSAHIKQIGIALLVIIVISKLFAPAALPTTSAVKLEQEAKAEGIVTAEELSKLPSNQNDFQLSVEYLKDLFSKNGFETSTFRLTDVYGYSITPAQEANGLQYAKRLAIRFAVKRKEDTTWSDLSAMKGIYTSLLSSQAKSGFTEDCKNDLFLDVTIWNGKRNVEFTAKTLLEDKGDFAVSFDYHRKNGFK